MTGVKCYRETPGRATFAHHQIDSNQKTRFIQPFADIVALSEREATPHWGTRARRYTWVKSIDIEAKVNWPRSVRVDPVQGHFYYIAYPKPIYLMHGERSDVMFPEDRLLSRVKVAKADIRQTRRRQVDGIKPREWGWLIARDTTE